MKPSFQKLLNGFSAFFLFSSFACIDIPELSGYMDDSAVVSSIFNMAQLYNNAIELSLFWYTLHFYGYGL